MKQVILNFKTGDLQVDDVPTPALRPGGVLVRNHYSLISAGTETSALDLASKSLLAKARSRPDLAKKVIDKARKDGIVTAFQQAMGRLDKPEALGYSSAGEVVAVGAGVGDLKVGDRVACAGVGYASHAEVVFVPRNLCVPVPDGVALRDAAATTVGAIAMQGVRIADVKLGERVVVIGLGLLGLITVQILKAAGCRVIGIDLDPKKVELAKQLGAAEAFVRSDPALETGVLVATGNAGADAVLITAATSSNDPVELAAGLCRDRATVVAVGAVGMDVPRNAFYEKELDLRLSRSYGPGRYDRSYEEDGRDYPIGYVRWTENRNMASFLDLLRDGAIEMAPLFTHEFGIEQALDAYAIVNGERKEPSIGILLDHGTSPVASGPVKIEAKTPKHRVQGEVRLGVVGAGTYGASTFLPALKKAKGIRLAALCTASGISAKKMAEKFGADYCTTDFEDLLKDENIDAVAILTRNSLHAPMAIQALNAGKHVFVEKPPALNEEELEALLEAWEASSGHLMVGYNRSHATMTKELLGALEGRKSPLVATYQVNAEAIPPDHWIYDQAEGGGRLLTEVCHFVDFLRTATGSEPVGVHAARAGGQGADAATVENVVLTLTFRDGSLGTVVYANQGSGSFAKERFTAHWDGKTAVLEDFRRLEVYGRGARTKKVLTQDKGHARRLEAFAEACSGTDALVNDFARTSRVTFAARESLETGRHVAVEE